MDKETKAYKEQDTEYKEYTIIHVSEHGDQWQIEIDSGWHLGLDKKEGHTPEANQKARLYGKGIGYSIRGVDIDNFTYYYKTHEQHEAEHRKYVEELTAERKESYEKNKNTYQKQYDELPDILKNRMDRLLEDELDTRYDWEPYELFILTEATKIFNALKTPEAIETFHNGTWETQKSSVPDLDEGHSGNTFGCATMFAYKMAKGEKDL